MSRYAWASKLTLLSKDSLDTPHIAMPEECMRRKVHERAACCASLSACWPACAEG